MRLLAWWRRRRARPFDWAEECPGLTASGGQRAHLARASELADGRWVVGVRVDPRPPDEVEHRHG
jgi:hypothetical protein